MAAILPAGLPAAPSANPPAAAPPASPPTLPSPYWLKWEKTIDKTAKIAGAVFLGMGVLTVSAVSGFPALLPVLAVPIIVVVAIGVTGAVAYYFYKQKTQAVKEQVTREAITFLYQNKGKLDDETREKLRKLTCHVDNIEIDATNLIKSTDLKITYPIYSLEKFSPVERNEFLKNIGLLFSEAKSLRLCNLKQSNLSEFAIMPLESLEVVGCDITDDQLKKFATQCPKLKKLSLTACDKITEKGLQPFEQNEIEEFTLASCRLTHLSMSPEDIFQTYKEHRNLLSSSRRVKEIVALKIQTNRDSIIDKGLGFEIIPYEQLKTLEKWKKLKELNLSHVNDATVVRLAQLPHLESLGILYSNHLTGSCFKTLRNANLQNIIIGRCKKLEKLEAYYDLALMTRINTIKFLNNPLKKASYERQELVREVLGSEFEHSDEGEMTLEGLWKRSE